MTPIEIFIAIASVIISLLGAWGIFSRTVGKYQEKIDTVIRDLHSLVSGIDRMKNDIQNIIERLSRLEGIVSQFMPAHQSRYIKEQSPLGLTHEGEALLQESGSKDFIDKNISLFMKAINEKAPQTAYDVQELCFKIIEHHSKDKDFIPIKKFLYKKPMDLKLIFEVCGLYLRDIYLESHPELIEN